jgi:hypothetical protein
MGFSVGKITKVNEEVLEFLGGPDSFYYSTDDTPRLAIEKDTSGFVDFLARNTGEAIYPYVFREEEHLLLTTKGFCPQMARLICAYLLYEYFDHWDSPPYEAGEREEYAVEREKALQSLLKEIRVQRS